MSKKHYYCMLGKPAPAQYVPVLMEKAEEQGWLTEHVMFVGHAPVSSLDIKQQGAVPVYVIVFSKWGDKEKKPPLPDMNFGNAPSDNPSGSNPGGNLPESAAPDNTVPFKGA